MIPRMIHYWWKNPDGTIHVQNAIMAHFGQHHVHTQEGFDKWKKNVKLVDLQYQQGKCGCTLKPGEVVDGFPPQMAEE